MSLTAALNNAGTGLSASSKMAQVISGNTANALTEGYARREISLSSASGGGVRVDSVSRMVSTSLLKEKWLSDAAAGNATIRAEFAARIETGIGDAETPGSLSMLLSDLETSLISARAQPESTAGLTAIATAAKAVTDKLNTVSDDIQSARLEADRSISAQVDTLNTALEQIQELNISITRLSAQGGDTNAMMDQRQTLIARIAEIVPINTIPRIGNQVALVTTGGQTLLDGTVAKIGFAATNVMSEDMSIGTGTLSGLIVNGHVVPTADSGRMGGGTLSAAFAIRDELAPAMQESLDSFARDLIQRFSGNSVDPTLSPGDAGLFTDNNAAFNSLNEVGIAGRITLNASTDPTMGGQVWRLRDGIGATAEGLSGNSTLLSAIQNALSTTTEVASGPFAGAGKTTYAFASDLLSLAASNRLGAETAQSYATARRDAASEQLLAEGVDTDAELQNLQLVEQSYSANARVLQAIDKMMQSILEI